MRNLILNPLVISAIIMISGSLVLADNIHVTGNVNGIWDVDTVLVDDEITIAQNDTLIIGPGVIILFNQHVKFIVEAHAVIHAIGNDSNYIIFDENITGNGWHGIRFLGSSNSSRLEFCHIKNGWAYGDEDDDSGGGIYISSCSPVIKNCIIENCRADDGGAIKCNWSAAPLIDSSTIQNNHAYSNGGGISCDRSSNPVITYNEIINNTTEGMAAGILCSTESDPLISHNILIGNWADGSIWGAGGIMCQYSSPTISHNVITACSTSSRGGAITLKGSSSDIIGNTIKYCSAGEGGAIMATYDSRPVISYNTIDSNYADRDGGAIKCNDGFPKISFNNISGNSADDGGGIFCKGNISCLIEGNIIDNNRALNNGGGIYMQSNTDTTCFNIMINNFAGFFGGSIYMEEFSSSVNYQNTICYNNASAKGGAIYCDQSDVHVLNSVLYYNNPQDSAQIFYINGSTAAIYYSDVQNITYGEGNIDADPLFRDAINGDYHLQSAGCGHLDNSPCIDAGAPYICDSLMDCGWGLGERRSDMGAYGGGDSTYCAVDGFVTSDNFLLPCDFNLFQNYPNPFNPTTTIDFELPQSSEVNLDICNILGQKVTSLVNEKLEAGYHSIRWNGTDSNGQTVASGVYFYRIKAGDYENSKKMLLLK